MLARVTIPLLCVPIAFFLVYLPKIAVSVAMAKRPEGYDNKSPREQQAKLEGWGARARNAHANGFEAFPAFAVGVLVSHAAGANPQWAAILAVTHLVTRTIYPVAYMANVAALRSSVWFIGFLASAGLMVLPLLR
jgi:uncharacterized MAPEG superfamily protein